MRKCSLCFRADRHICQRAMTKICMSYQVLESKMQVVSENISAVAENMINVKY